jgi:hypothetical protein
MKKNKGFWGLFRKDEESEEDDLRKKVLDLEAEFLIMLAGIKQLAESVENLTDYVTRHHETINELVERYNEEETNKKSSLFRDPKTPSKPN